MAGYCANFEQEVLESDKPVLADFCAEWCGPCHAGSPILARIVAEGGDELTTGCAYPPCP